VFYIFKRRAVFKDGGKLKRNDSWTMNDQTIQVTTDIVMLQYLYKIEDNGINKKPQPFANVKVHWN